MSEPERDTPHVPAPSLWPIGFDATAKGPDEGAREWPPEIEMTAEVKQRVDARWAELGLPAPSVDGTVQNGRRGAGRRRPGWPVRR